MCRCCFGCSGREDDSGDARARRQPPAAGGGAGRRRRQPPTGGRARGRADLVEVGAGADPAGADAGARAHLAPSSVSGAGAPARLGQQQVARFAGPEHGAAVEELGDQADRDRSPTSAAATDRRRRGRRACGRCRRAGWSASTDLAASAALGVAQDGDVEAGRPQPRDDRGAGVRRRPSPASTCRPAPAPAPRPGRRSRWSRPPCSAQSPSAWIAVVGDRRPGGVHDDARGGPSSPARRASAVAGRHAGGEHDQVGVRVWPLSSDAARLESVGEPAPRGRRRSTVGARAGAGRGRAPRRPGRRPGCASRCSAPSTTSVGDARARSAPRATWRPSSPPPTTTARRAPGTGGVEAAAVGQGAEGVHPLVRAAVVDATSPRIGGSVGMLPVASTSAVVGDPVAVDEHHLAAPRGRSRATRAAGRRLDPVLGDHAARAG